MQFFAYDPNFDPSKISAEPPPQEMMEAMGKFIQEAQQANVLVTTGALPPMGVRLERKNGQFSVSDSPSIELKELMAGWAVIRTDTIEEAIEWCKRFRDITGDGVTEIVQVFGPEDLS